VNQSFDTQLQVMKRALTDVVMPALDGAGNHVLEQLHLSLAVADFMQRRLPHARRFYRTELRGYASLAGKINALLSSQGGNNSDDELQNLFLNADELIGDPEGEWEDYIELTRQIRTRISQLTESASGQSFEDELDNLVLSAAEDASLQARIWCVPFGFELNEDSLPAADWLER
jgi:hypothetical protein